MRLLLSSLTAAALAGSAMVPVAQAAPFAGQSAVEQSADGLAAIEKTQYAWVARIIAGTPMAGAVPAGIGAAIVGVAASAGAAAMVGMAGTVVAAAGTAVVGTVVAGTAVAVAGTAAVVVGMAVAAAGMAAATAAASTAVAASMAAADMVVAGTAVVATAAIANPSQYFELAIGGISRRFLLTARPAFQDVRSKIR